MNGSVEDVFPRVEDRLRTVPVMGVEVDDGNLLKGAPQNLCRDRCIVEVAEAGSTVGISVVPGRPAQRECSRLAREHCFGSRNGGLRRCVCGPEGTFHDGAGQIAHVPSGSTDNAYRAWAIAAHEV